MVVTASQSQVLATSLLVRVAVIQNNKELTMQYIGHIPKKVKRAVSSTPRRKSSLKDLGYSKTQISRIKDILKELK